MVGVDMPEPTESTDEPLIVITTKPGKYRLECPEGHKNWRIWDGVFSCVSCRRQLNADDEAVEDSVYEELVDTKTGQRVTRDQVRIDVNEGQPARGD